MAAEFCSQAITHPPPESEAIVPGERLENYKLKLKDYP
jgi:hypothetical protein